MHPHTRSDTDIYAPNPVCWFQKTHLSTFCCRSHTSCECCSRTTCRAHACVCVCVRVRACVRVEEVWLWDCEGVGSLTSNHNIAGHSLYRWLACTATDNKTAHKKSMELQNSLIHSPEQQQAKPSTQHGCNKMPTSLALLRRNKGSLDWTADPLNGHTRTTRHKQRNTDHNHAYIPPGNCTPATLQPCFYTR